MHIKRVTIRGFKTYKEQTQLSEDFAEGTNVIVGFNGAGKSNFFQAILFVLSDQYTNLRAETRKALLHEGAGQAVLTCFVEVTLCNKDGRIPIDNKEEVTIRRTLGMKKDDWSLDGKGSSRSEIFGLLESAGFSKSSPYYVVQQGKVSELTVMTDTQRLGLLKDIAGASVYDQRRAESVKIMQDTQERGNRAAALILEIRQRLTVLETEQQELQECELLESRRRTLEYSLADREWRSSQEQLDSLGAKKEECLKRLQELQVGWSDVRKQLNSAEVSLDKAEEDRQRLEEGLAGFESERTRKLEELSKARLEAEEASRQRAASEMLAKSHLDELSQLRGDVAACTETLAQMHPKVELAEAQLRDLEQQRQVAVAQREQLLARQDRGRNFKTISDRNSALDEEIRTRTIKLKEARRRLEEVSGRAKATEDLSRASAKSAGEAREAMQPLEAQLQALGHTARNLNERLDRAAEQLRLLHQERGEAQRRLAQLRQEAASSQQRLDGTLPRSCRQAIQAVTRWAKEKGLEDRIKGPLIEFISVSPTYYAALESFAGMALFNILADDDEAAALAVKYVRQSKLGAVTVTPLQQLRTRDHQYPNIEGAKPMISLIKYPDWALPAIKQVFGRAMVCRSMEVCEQVARCGLDAITMDGDRVSRKGVITGGYQDPQRFVRIALQASVKDARAKLVEAERRLPELEDKIQQASETSDALHAERREVGSKRDEARGTLQQLMEKAQSEEAREAKCARELKDFREWQHQVEVLIKEAEASIEAKKAEKSSKSLANLSPADEEKLRNLTEKLQELENQQVAARDECRKSREALEEVQARLQSTLNPRLRTLEQDVTASAGDEASERSEALAQTRGRLEREYQEAESGAIAAASALEKLGVQVEILKKQKEDFAKRESALQEEASQANAAIDNLNAEISTHMEKKVQVEAQLHTVAAAPADVERCRECEKSVLISELRDTNKRLLAFPHVNRKAVEQYENFSSQLVDVCKRKEDVDAAEIVISEALQRIDQQKEVAILQTLDNVNVHFQQVFQEMVPGGVGKLHVVKQDESSQLTPASQTQHGSLSEIEGVRLEVSFTGQEQSFQLMSQLSGGQKTVVALSLIFAIQRLEPAPFYLLDEVDAALDASYRTALANLIDRTAGRGSQVVLTTFRPEAVAKAKRCYRVFQRNRASQIEPVSREVAIQVLQEQDRLDQERGEAEGLQIV